MLCYQRTSCLLAAFGNPIYDLCGYFNVEFTTSEVIQEKQWLRIMRENIVHAHSYQIYAHRIMLIAFDCYLQKKLSVNTTD